MFLREGQNILDKNLNITWPTKNPIVSKKDKKNLKFNFKIGTVKCPKKISRPKLVFDVNYYKDYLFISKIYEYFLPKKKFFTATDVIKWYEKKYSRKELK